MIQSPVTYSIFLKSRTQKKGVAMPQTYVSPNEFMGSMPAIAAGKTGTPEVITGVGA